MEMGCGLVAIHANSSFRVVRSCLAGVPQGRKANKSLIGLSPVLVKTIGQNATPYLRRYSAVSVQVQISNMDCSGLGYRHLIKLSEAPDDSQSP